MAEETGGTVTPLFPDPGDAPVTQDERLFGCMHNSVRLNVESRRVHCQECGREVEAFKALQRFASQWDRYMLGIERLKSELQRLEARVEELKREERNTKARLRRARG